MVNGKKFTYKVAAFSKSHPSSGQAKSGWQVPERLLLFPPVCTDVSHTGGIKGRNITGE